VSGDAARTSASACKKVTIVVRRGCPTAIKSEVASSSSGRKIEYVTRKRKKSALGSHFSPNRNSTRSSAVTKIASAIGNAIVVTIQRDIIAVFVKRATSFCKRL